MAKASSIMDYFPGTPRPVQVKALQALEEVWDQADVLVVALPVASGKSRIAYTLARWLSKRKVKSAITTPSKILVEQYCQDFPQLHSLKAMNSYSCERYESQEQKLTCGAARDCDEDRKFCPGCPYVKNIRKTHVMPFGVYNNFTFMAHKIFREVLIADEAHQLIPLIQEMAGKKLWQRDYKFPSWVRSYSALLKWITSHPQREKDAKLSLLHKELTSGRIHYLAQRTTDLYRGREEEVIKLLPIDISQQPPFLWPQGKTKKIVLLSATIGRKDIEMLGLDKRRVRFISADSPIPADRRPIIVSSSYGMSLKDQEANLPLLAADIKKLLATNSEKGFIHAPYALAEKLYELLSDEPRLLWHDRENKGAQYQAFRDSPAVDGRVMVASGLYEGVDLLEDMGRWQVITKCPWPSLGEPAIAYKAETDPEWYAYETAKVVLQAAGRICRSPVDFGSTTILDKSFIRLYDDYREFFPDWWQASVAVRESK